MYDFCLVVEDEKWFTSIPYDELSYIQPPLLWSCKSPYDLHSWLTVKKQLPMYLSDHVNEIVKTCASCLRVCTAVGSIGMPPIPFSADLSIFTQKSAIKNKSFHPHKLQFRGVSATYLVQNPWAAAYIFYSFCHTIGMPGSVKTMATLCVRTDCTCMHYKNIEKCVPSCQEIWQLSCPNAMHRKFRLLSPGEMSSHSTALPSFWQILLSRVQCFCVSIPPAVRPTLTTDGYGIFNMCTSVGWCRTHEGVSGSNESVQESTRSGEQKQLLLSYLPCPARGLNPGSSDLNSDAQTTELRPHPRRGTVHRGTTCNTGSR